MVSEGTGALLVRGEGGDGLGILTDRDIRSRVVARGASADDPVRAVMTAPVISVDAGASTAEVMLTMLDNDIHHVPVVSGPDILGVIEEIDLLTAGQRSPFVLRRAIAQALARRSWLSWPAGCGRGFSPSTGPAARSRSARRSRSSPTR